MPDHFLYDVFISYSSSDLAFAEQLHQRLVDAGFRVWFDKARLNPGCNWHNEIEAGCESSRVILPVLTPRWKESKWTKFETYGADCVIPIVPDGNSGEVFTPPIKRFQSQRIELDVTNANQWQRLFEAIRSELEKPEPDKVQRLADVRYQSNPYFVGREAELLQIHEELHNNPTTVLTQGRVRAIAALGGVGKTTLAREYIEQFWRCYSQIFWVDCRKGVETELARICDILLSEYRMEKDVPAKAKIAYQQLLGREDRLLVYDNAEDEVSLQTWIPKSGHCRTLITSRFSAWSAGIKTIQLYVLDAEPAWALLAGRAGRRTLELLNVNEQASCKKLAEMLGYLPLALEQAAAYVEQQGAGFLFADYIRLYESSAAELLSAGVMGSTEYPDAVMVTWKTTVAKLSTVAQAILRLCSFMAPTPIPLSVLVNSTDEILAEGNSPSSTEGSGEVLVRSNVQQLRAYSMVGGDGQVVQLHPLVQTVERLQVKEKEQEVQVIGRVLGMLANASDLDSQDLRSWPMLESIKVHIITTIGLAEIRSTSSRICCKLLRKIGILDYAKARYAEAEPLMRRELAICEQLYGPNDTKVAVCLSNLTSVLYETNRLSEAEPLMRRVVSIFCLSCGVYHPNVATAINNLAQLLQVTNRLIEAEPLMRSALAIYEQINGPEHPDVATSLNNLALLLKTMNRLSEADPLMRRALAIDEQSHAPVHPNTARELNNLAQLLQVTDRLTEAEPLMWRALEIDEQSYGSEHPTVARDLGNLGALLFATNRLQEAESLMRRSLAITEKFFDGEHPAIALGLGNLASLLQATNRLQEAEPLMRRALAINELSCGTEHPNVAISLNNLAQLLQDTNRLPEAERLIRRALAIDEQSYGPEHPKVAGDLNNLALLFKDTNRLAEAEPLMRRALAIDEQSYGPEHPQVAIVLNNLATLLEATNRLSDAEPLMWRALSIEEQSYGPEHPEVAVQLNNLGQLLKATNRLSEAEPLMRRQILIFQNFGKLTGHQHPHVRASIFNYRSLLTAFGKTESEIDQIISDLLK